MIGWDKLLDGDLAVHVEDDLRSGAFGEIMNPRQIQYEELWVGMPVYLFVQSGRHCGVQYKAVVLIAEPDARGRIGCAIQQARGEWSPLWAKLSLLRHREARA